MWPWLCNGKVSNTFWFLSKVSNLARLNQCCPNCVPPRNFTVSRHVAKKVYWYKRSKISDLSYIISKIWTIFNENCNAGFKKYNVGWCRKIFKIILVCRGSKSLDNTGLICIAWYWKIFHTNRNYCWYLLVWIFAKELQSEKIVGYLKSRFEALIFLPAPNIQLFSKVSNLSRFKNDSNSELQGIFQSNSPNKWISRNMPIHIQIQHFLVTQSGKR